MTGQDELLRGLCTAQILTQHNPCRLSDLAFRALAKGLNTLMSREYSTGISQDKVAIYMGVTARTLRRWAQKYPDFPKPRYDGFHEPSYDPIEVVQWWEQHRTDTVKG